MPLGVFATDSKEIQEVDWNDFKNGIINSTDKLDPHNTESIYKVILRDYLIPKAEGQEYKTLYNIGREVDLSESRLSQMIHSEKMKDFIFNAYEIER